MTKAGQPASTGALATVRAGLIVLTVIVLLLCSLLLWRFWQAETADAEARTSATAALLDRGANATFDKIRIAIDNVASQIEWQLAGAGIDAAALWSVVDRAAPEIERIGLFDDQGHQVCGIPADRCRNLDVSDRDYFARLREHPDAPTMLVGPLVSRSDSLPAMLMVRAVGTATKRTSATERRLKSRDCRPWNWRRRTWSCSKPGG